MRHKKIKDPEKERLYNKLRRRKYYKTRHGKEIVKRLTNKAYEKDKLTGKAQARTLLNQAVKDGKVKKPKVCSRCKTNPSRIEGHHPDYSKPLMVLWLCSPCNNIVQKEERIAIALKN